MKKTIFEERKEQLEKIINNQNMYRCNLREIGLGDTNSFFNIFEELKPIFAVKQKKDEITLESLSYKAEQTGNLDKIIVGTLLQLKNENEKKFREHYKYFNTADYGGEAELNRDMRKKLNNTIADYNRLRNAALYSNMGFKESRLMEKYSSFLLDVKDLDSKFNKITDGYTQGRIDSKAKFKECIDEIKGLSKEYLKITKSFKRSARFLEVFKGHKAFEYLEVIYEIKRLKNEFNTVLNNYGEINHTINSLRDRNSNLEKVYNNIDSALIEPIFEGVGDYKSIINEAKGFLNTSKPKFSEIYLLKRAYGKTIGLEKKTSALVDNFSSAINELVNREMIELQNSVDAAPQNPKDIIEYLSKIGGIKDYILNNTHSFGNIQELLSLINSKHKEYKTINNEIQEIIKKTKLAAGSIEQNKKILKKLENNEYPQDYSQFVFNEVRSSNPLISQAAKEYNLLVKEIKNQYGGIEEGVQSYKDRKEKQGEIERECIRLQSAIRKGDYLIYCIPGKFKDLEKDEFLRKNVNEYNSLVVSLEDKIRQEKEKLEKSRINETTYTPRAIPKIDTTISPKKSDNLKDPGTSDYYKLWGVVTGKMMASG